jgi:ATP-binding cassette subfamily F protein uup
LQRELDALPGQIEQLESQVAQAQAVISEPAFYQRPHTEVQRALDELRELQERLDTAIERWAELEDQAAALATSAADVAQRS